MSNNQMITNLLYDRLKQLKQWEQPESLKEILFDTFTSLSEYSQERFDEFAQEIKNESAFNKDVPAIKLAVCTEENIDELQMFLRPVSVEQPESSQNYIATVFVECDYPTIQSILKHSCTATIWSKTGMVRVQAELKYSSKYLTKIESLYHVFSENELPWTTVNGEYIYKFLDVYSKQEIARDIEKYEIDIAQYNKYVSYDKVLLWNVEQMTRAVEKCYAKPAYDALQYEHLLKKLDSEKDEYLVCPLGDRFNSFRNDKLMYVRTYTKQLAQIDLIRVITTDSDESKLYLPVKSNKKSSGLVSAMARGAFVPTRGEAERIIHTLGASVGLRLIDIAILPFTDKNIERYKGIDFNYFREDNMILSDRKLLLFSFEKGADSIWWYETMFYALSELQLYFYEYLCVGELI